MYQVILLPNHSDTALISNTEQHHGAMEGIDHSWTNTKTKQSMCT